MRETRPVDIVILLSIFLCTAAFAVLQTTSSAEETVLRPNFTQEHITNRYTNKTTIQKRDVVYRNSYEYDRINFQRSVSGIDFDYDDNELSVSEIDGCMKLFGRSMQPAIWDGNTVCYQSIDGEDADQGDIIYYKRKDEKVFHTVVGEYHNWGYVLAKGYSSFEGEKVEHDEIIGQVVAVVYTDS